MKLAPRRELSFTKVALVENTADIVLLDFWLMLLSWRFVSSYTIIYFFVKKFIFSNVYITVEYDIRMSLCVFFEKGAIS